MPALSHDGAAARPDRRAGYNRAPMASDVNSGLEGVIAAETSITLVDGQAGRLLYRGYEIGDLAEHGSYDRVVGLLLDGELAMRDEVLPPASFRRPCSARCARCPPRAPRWMPCARRSRRSAQSGAWTWPPTAEQARELIALAPAAVGAFARLRDSQQPVNWRARRTLGTAARLLLRDHGRGARPRARRGRWTRTSSSVPSTG